MPDTIETDLCVIGAGSAGLSVAAGASQMGARVVLIEKGEMGGDCLNYGCVPSKALLAAAKAAVHHRHAGALGVEYAAPTVDMAAVRAHVRGVIETIRPMDSEERFEALGVTVLREEARFLDSETLAAGEHRIKAKRFVIATGSQPLVPPVAGLDETPYFTNETIFDLDTIPEHLVVVGGGPIGCELSQAFARLGAKVSLVEMARLLPKDDPEAAAVVRRALRADGITLHEGAEVAEVAGDEGDIRVTIKTQAGEDRLQASHLLLAVGRVPGVKGLDLEKADIAYDRKGIKVDRGLRTSNRRAYAIGDVAGGLQFTHVAGYHAGLVIRSALFRLPVKTSDEAIPWVTYTDPELAHVGLDEAAAREAGKEVRILRWPLGENDRAHAERLEGGFVKAVVSPRGKVLGCTIVGSMAGELIQPWILAIDKGLGIGAMAGMVAPYPTLGEAGKRAAGTFFTPKLFGDFTKKVVRLLLHLP